MALQGIGRISAGMVQINSGRPIIEGTRVFVDRLIGHLENGVSVGEICQEYDLTLEQVMAVEKLSLEQVQYVKGYAVNLEAQSACGTGTATARVATGQARRLHYGVSVVHELG